MKILDRYILSELMGPFFFGIAAFSAILASSTVLFPLIGLAVKFGIPTLQTLQLFVYRVPTIIVFTFPMAMLLGSIIAVSRLNSDLEIMAFRSAGISIFRIVIPIIIAGFFVSLITILFNEVVVPKATHSAEKLEISLTRTDTPKIKKNINFTEYDSDGLPVRVINVVEVNQRNLRDITIAEYANGQLMRLIRAKTGQWLPSGGWEFYDGVMHVFGQEDTKKLMFLEFEKEYIDIQVNPLDLTGREKTAEEMSLKELKSTILFNKKTGKDVNKQLVKYHMRFSIPFASLIFAIIGASVGLKPIRSTSSIGLGISLVIIIFYYALISTGMYLGLSGMLPAVVAVWIPNIVIGLVGLYMLRRHAYH